MLNTLIKDPKVIEYRVEHQRGLKMTRRRRSINHYYRNNVLVHLPTASIIHRLPSKLCLKLRVKQRRIPSLAKIRLHARLKLLPAASVDINHVRTQSSSHQNNRRHRTYLTTTVYRIIIISTSSSMNRNIVIHRLSQPDHSHVRDNLHLNMR